MEKSIRKLALIEIMNTNYLEQLNKAFECHKLGDAKVYIFDEVDSTNTEAKRHCLSGGAVPALFIARSQSAGRGRMGRSFFSPSDTGIYLSILTQAPKENSGFLKVTSASAVALHKSIFEELGIIAKIKWVNDLYLEGKKISGILAESFFVDDKRYIVVGVGINLCTKDFPEELRDKAGSIISEGDGQNSAYIMSRLAVRVAENLFDVLGGLDGEWIIDYYREHSAVLGKRVTFTENGVAQSGIAEAIDELGALSVRLDDGSEYILSSGEISLKID